MSGSLLQKQGKRKSADKGTGFFSSYKFKRLSRDSPLFQPEFPLVNFTFFRKTPALLQSGQG